MADDECVKWNGCSPLIGIVLFVFIFWAFYLVSVGSLYIDEVKLTQFDLEHEREKNT